MKHISGKYPDIPGLYLLSWPYWQLFLEKKLRPLLRFFPDKPMETFQAFS